jgi:hypothetical protein
MAALPGQAIVKLTNVARWAGLAAGASLALVAVSAARVPAGTHEVPARVSVVAEPAVQLGVSPVARELLSARRLVPGAGSVSGLVQISNLTGAPLSAVPRVRSLRGEAPEALHIELTAGGRTLYSGKLSDLHARVGLGARSAARVRLRISAPSRSRRELRGRAVDLSLRWATRGKRR